MSRRYELVRSQLVPCPRPEVWRFFADPGNLEAITPDFLRFHVVTPEPAMRPGALIDYRLRLFGVPLSWRTLISEVDPGRAFVDEQLRGPYRRWRHLHTFVDAPGGTLVEDRVEYELPLGPLGALARAAFVARTLDRIFDHRAARVAALLAPPPARATAAR